MTNESILVVDDEDNSRKLVSLILSAEGYRVETVDGHEAAMNAFHRGQFDLVVLDILMPGIDGWETCKQLRRESDVPIMLVSALNHDQDIVRGLRVGADDFYVKPVHRDLFLARVEALIRRSRAQNDPTKSPDSDFSYDDGYLQIDLAARSVHVNHVIVSFTPTELNLLSYLLHNADHAVTYRQILDEVWGWADEDRIGYVHTYISRLRQKLERDPAHPAYIANEYGYGYRFNTKT